MKTLYFLLAVVMAALITFALPQATMAATAKPTVRQMYEHLPNPITDSVWKFVGTDYQRVLGDARHMCNDSTQRVLTQEMSGLDGAKSAPQVFAWYTKQDYPVSEAYRTDAAKLNKDLKAARIKAGNSTPSWVPSRAPTLYELDYILRNAGCHAWSYMVTGEMYKG